MKKNLFKTIAAVSTAAMVAAMPVLAEAKTYIIATDTTFPPFDIPTADGEMEGIQTGQADGVIAGMSITEERKEKFDFSEPYYDADVTMAVAAGSDIASYEDLKDQKVAVKTATNGADYAKSIADEYEFEIVEFKDSPTMYQDVQLGNTVACFEDFPVMAYNIQQGAPMQIPEGMTAAGSSYGFAVQKDQNTELLEMFDAGLKNIKENGVYDEIVAKYTEAAQEAETETETEAE